MSVEPVQAERSPREGVLAGPHCPAQHHGEPRHHGLQAQHHAPADLSSSEGEGRNLL